MKYALTMTEVYDLSMHLSNCENTERDIWS